MAGAFSAACSAGRPEDGDEDIFFSFGAEMETRRQESEFYISYLHDTYGERNAGETMACDSFFTRCLGSMIVASVDDIRKHMQLKLIQDESRFISILYCLIGPRYILLA